MSFIFLYFCISYLLCHKHFEILLNFLLQSLDNNVSKMYKYVYIYLNRERKIFCIEWKINKFLWKIWRVKIPKVLVLQSLMFAFNSSALFIKFLTIKSFSFTVEWKMIEEDLSVVVRTDWIRKNTKMTHDSHQPYLLFFRNQKKKREREKEKRKHIEPFSDFWASMSFYHRLHTCVDRKRKFTKNIKRTLNVFFLSRTYMSRKCGRAEQRIISYAYHWRNMFHIHMWL